MKKLLNDWFTGPCNDNYEAGRFLWFISVLSMIAYGGWHLYHNGEFDVMQYGMALSALIAAGGFGISQKDKGAREARQ